MSWSDTMTKKTKWSVAWVLALGLAAGGVGVGCSDDGGDKSATQQPDASGEDTTSGDDVQAPDDAHSPDDASPGDDTADGTGGDDAELPSRMGWGPQPILFTTGNVVTADGVCFDFDEAVALDCTSGVADWDLMFDVDVARREFNIWTNGGVKGAADGKGVSFGPLAKEEYDQFPRGEVIPGWFPDFYGGIFADFTWYDYDVYGSHDITVNGRVYVVDTGADKFKVQLISYYGPGGASAMVTMRYAKLGETDYGEVTLDATAGGFGANDPRSRAAYFDLDTGTVVDINDEEAKANAVWDISVKRYEVKLNGGDVGPGGVTGAIADKRAHLYDADGLPVRTKFDAIDDDDMLAAFEAVDSDDGLTYVSDRGQPYIIGDGGVKSWFGVNPPPPIPPTFFARSENWWAVRSSAGDSYMLFHVTSVDYSDFNFTIEGYVQPRQP